MIIGVEMVDKVISRIIGAGVGSMAYLLACSSYNNHKFHNTMQDLREKGYGLNYTAGSGNPSDRLYVMKKDGHPLGYFDYTPFTLGTAGSMLNPFFEPKFFPWRD